MMERSGVRNAIFIASGFQKPYEQYEMPKSLVVPPKAGPSLIPTRAVHFRDIPPDEWNELPFTERIKRTLQDFWNGPPQEKPQSTGGFTDPSQAEDHAGQAFKNVPPIEDDPNAAYGMSYYYNPKTGKYEPQLTRFTPENHPDVFYPYGPDSTSPLNYGRRRRRDRQQRDNTDPFTSQPEIPSQPGEMQSDHVSDSEWNQRFATPEDE